MKIQLPDLGFADRKPRFYVGQRSRFARATAVRLTSPSTLLCCDLEGEMMYDVRFSLSDKSYEVLKAVPTTTAAGRVVGVDTFDCPSGDVLYAACCGGPVTVWDVPTLRPVHDIPLHGMIHSVRQVPAFGPRSPMFAVSYVDERRVDVISMATGKVEVLSSHQGGWGAWWSKDVKRRPWRAKDCCFVGNEVHVLWGGTDVESEPGLTSSKLTLHTFDQHDGVIADPYASCDLPFQGDTICMDDRGLLVLNAQDMDSVEIIDVSRSYQVASRLEGYDMPHGVDQRFGLIAVACYGDNTVDVRQYA